MKIRNAIWFLVLLASSGCGYHLRGSLDSSQALKNIYVFGATSALNSEILAIVKASKSSMAASPNEASVVIKILKEDMRTRILSIGAAGKSSESELDYYLRFQYYDNKENALMDEQTIEMAREFFNDQTAVLAKDNEEQIIRKEMYKQVARMLIARAQIALSNDKK